MTNSTQPRSTRTAPANAAQASGQVLARIKSSELFGPLRELEIDHEGRIYRLRMTQLNKLILTA